MKLVRSQVTVNEIDFVTATDLEKLQADIKCQLFVEFCKEIMKLDFVIREIKSPESDKRIFQAMAAVCSYEEFVELQLSLAPSKKDSE